MRLKTSAALLFLLFPSLVLAQFSFPPVSPTRFQLAGTTQAGVTTVNFSTGLTGSLASGTLAVTVVGGVPVPATRTITTTAPLFCDSGASCDLSANRTLSIDPVVGTPLTATSSPVFIKGGAQTESATAYGVVSDTPANWVVSGKMHAFANNGTARAYIQDETSLGVNITRLGSLSAYMWMQNSANDRWALSNGAAHVAFGGTVAVNFTSILLYPQTNAVMDLGIDAQAFRRLRLDGTAPVTGDFVLSANWGTAPTTTGIDGSDSHVLFDVTAKATTGADPTIVYTFKNGTWTQHPFCTVDLVAVTGGGAGDLTSAVTWVAAATTITITYNTTPTANGVYTFQILCIGQ